MDSSLSLAARPRLATAERWAFALILLIAIVARLREAFAIPLWFDEIDTLWTARRGFLGVIAAAAADVHPPLHFLLVWGWRALGGEGDLWIKSSSLVAGVALVAVMLPLGRDLFDRRAGLLGAALLALHPVHVYFSQEARFYPLLWLELAAAAWLAWRWIAGGGARDAAGFVVASALALYTHYFAGVVLAFLALWGVIVLAREPRSLVRWLALELAVAVLFLPQLVTLLTQVRRIGAEHWTHAPVPGDLIDLLRYLSLAGYLIPPMLLLALLPLIKRETRPAASLLWTVSLPPVLLAFALSRAGMHLFLVRWMLFVTPAWCALVAAAVTGLSPAWLRRAAVVTVLALSTRALVLLRPLAEATSLARVAATIGRDARPGVPVVCADTHSLLFFGQHLAGRVRPLLLLTAPRIPYYDGDAVIPAEWRLTPVQFDSLSRSGVRWWGVRAAHSGMDPAPAVALIRSAASGPAIAIGGVLLWSGGGEPDSSASKPAAARR